MVCQEGRGHPLCVCLSRCPPPNSLLPGDFQNFDARTMFNIPLFEQRRRFGRSGPSPLSRTGKGSGSQGSAKTAPRNNPVKAARNQHPEPRDRQAKYRNKSGQGGARRLWINCCHANRRTRALSLAPHFPPVVIDQVCGNGLSSTVNCTDVSAIVDGLKLIVGKPQLHDGQNKPDSRVLRAMGTGRRGKPSSVVPRTG